MKPKTGNAILSVILALMLAALACAGGSAAPTTAPATAAPTQAPPTQAAPTQAPTTAAATVAPTQAPKATDMQTAATTAAPTAAPSATKAALSGTLDVKGVSTYVDNSQFLHLVGLVTNGTDKPVENIELSVQVTDSAGKTVLKDDSGKLTNTVLIAALLGTIDSGGSTPFRFDMNVNGADTSAWKPTVKITQSDNPSPLQRAPVDVVNPQLSVHSDGQVYLTGELANKSDKSALINDFAGAMLDTSGNVAGAASFSSVTRLLAPAGDASGSDRTPFVITIDGPVKKDSKPAFYLDTVEGTTDDMAAASNLRLKLNTSYVDADSGVHVVATISNSGTNTLTVQAVAGLYDQSGAVLDADSVSTQFDLAPGASTPAIFYYFGNLNGNADAIAKVVSYTAQIDPHWTFASSLDLVTLQATNVVTVANGSSAEISGTIANTSKQNIATPTVIIEAKDATGNIVAADWVGTSGSAPIKPGQKVTFDLTMQLPDKTDASTLKYEMAVQSHVSQ